MSAGVFVAWLRFLLAPGLSCWQGFSFSIDKARQQLDSCSPWPPE